jgi:hypothetical protein
MSKLLALLLVLNIGLFVWNGWEASTFAQLPPETDVTGVPFFKVNINPTPVAPLVNINPPGQLPQVEVTRMPPLTLAPAACDRAANFVTGVGTSVSGPITVGFLNVPSQASVTFVDGDRGSFTITLNTPPQMGSAIYLQAGQRLDFGSDAMFSGCRPAA